MKSQELRKVTKEFNYYRSPECRAQTLFNEEDVIKIKFSGTKAGFACCFDENFQDFRYYLKDIAKVEATIEKIKRTKNNNFIISYRISKEKDK